MICTMNSPVIVGGFWLLSTLRDFQRSPKGSQGLISVCIHVDLAPDDSEHPAILADDECVPFHRDRAEPTAHTEGVGDRSVCVAEQRKPEVVGLRELLLLANIVSADAYWLRTDRAELSGQVAEMASLRGTAARHGGRVEEQHDRAAFEELAQLSRGAVLVGQFEIVNLITCLHPVQGSSATAM